MEDQGEEEWRSRERRNKKWRRKERRGGEKVELRRWKRRERGRDKKKKRRSQKLGVFQRKMPSRRWAAVPAERHARKGNDVCPATKRYKDQTAV